MAQQDVADILPTVTPRPYGPAAKLGGVKRYNLTLPEELFDEVQALADRKQTTVVELLRRFIKLGLLAAAVEDMPDGAFFIRENGVERQIIFI